MTGQGLPVVSGQDTIRAFEKAGWTAKKQGATSHISMYKLGERAILVVPQHRELAKGTLRALIRDAGMTVDEFKNLL